MHRIRVGAITAVFVLLFFSPVVHADTCATGLCNPLQFSDIQSFIAGALKALVQIALPIIALFIVYSGFLFVSARGNAEQIKTAKRNFVYVVIGTLLILGAWELSTIIGGTVSQLTG